MTIAGAPLVSVIVSVYKAQKFIIKKIDDLLRQSIIDQTEIIIIDSGSPENEKEIISLYSRLYPQIKYTRTEERETLYAAWNRAIRTAKGQFITNSNADDLLRKDALEILSGYLLRNPGTGMVYADQILTSEPNKSVDELTDKKLIRFPDFNYVYMLERCIIGSQPMWRADIHFDQNIWFDESFEVSGDHEFELRVAGVYQITHISETLGTFYKAADKSNKETENLARTAAEVNRITNSFTDHYLSRLSVPGMQNLLNAYIRYLRTPALLYIAAELSVRYLTPNIYKKYLFHSVEFTYWFTCKILLSYKREKEVIKYCKKYLRYKKSEKIELLLKGLYNEQR